MKIYQVVERFTSVEELRWFYKSMQGAENGRLDESAQGEKLLNRLNKISRGQLTEKIRKKYRHLKNYPITVEDLTTIAIENKVFNDEDCNTVNNHPENIRKMGVLWKKLLRKGEEACHDFIKELAKREYQDLVEDIIKSDEEQDGTLDQEDDDENVSRDVISRNVDFLKQEIKISTGIADILFENSIIDIDDHDSIDVIQNRKGQREQLIDLLLEKPNDTWISPFVKFLKKTGHAVHNLNSLRGEARDLDQRRRVGLRLGNTAPVLGNTIVLPGTNILVGIRGPRNQADNFSAIVSRTNEMRSLFQEMLDAEVIEYREGSIYFHLYSFSNTLMEIIKNQDEITIRSFLQRLFSGNIDLVNYFEKNTVVELIMKEVPENGSFLNGMKVEEQKLLKENCTECYRWTLRKNFQLVIDEIEDDIIDDTMKRVHETRKKNNTCYNAKECFPENKTRYDRAFGFLQYVLCNEDVLFEFKEAFSCRSRVTLQPFECNICSGLDDEHEVSVELKRPEREVVLYFRVSIDASGTVNVTQASKENYIPPDCPRLRENKQDIQKKLLRTKTFDFSMTKALEEYRIIIIDETGRTGTVDFIAASKSSEGKILRFYRLPSFRLDEKNEEWKRESIAQCIAFSSPGPHGFVLITDVFKLFDLADTLRPYRNLFGSDIMKYLIVIFTTDDNFRYAPEDYIRSSFRLGHILPIASNRCICFENKIDEDKKYAQLGHFVKSVLNMMSQNEGQHYSNSIFEESEKEIQQTTKALENEKQQELRTLQERIRNLKGQNTRDKAMAELYSTRSFIARVKKFTNI